MAKRRAKFIFGAFQPNGKIEQKQTRKIKEKRKAGWRADLLNDCILLKIRSGDAPLRVSECQHANLLILFYIRFCSLCFSFLCRSALLVSYFVVRGYVCRTVELLFLFIRDEQKMLETNHTFSIYASRENSINNASKFHLTYQRACSPSTIRANSSNLPVK